MYGSKKKFTEQTCLLYDCPLFLLLPLCCFPCLLAIIFSVLWHLTCALPTPLKQSLERQPISYFLPSGDHLSRLTLLWLLLKLTTSIKGKNNSSKISVLHFPQRFYCHILILSLCTFLPTSNYDDEHSIGRHSSEHSLSTHHVLGTIWIRNHLQRRRSYNCSHLTDAKT